MMDAPGLRGHDAQILVGAGIRSAKALAEASARDVFKAATGFLNSEDGANVVSEKYRPDMDEITQWIRAAQD